MKNVVIFFTDQQRYDSIGALGNPAVQTPHLDELANDSTVFERCITPSPVCVPARLSMFAGQYAARTGCSNNNGDCVYDGEGFYSRITAQGYQSCCVGKMHHMIDKYGLMGFEKRLSQEGVADPADDYTQFIEKNYPHVYDYHGMRSEMYYVPQISQLPSADHPTQWVGDRSIEFLKQCDPDRPVFLMSSFYHPHPPYCPPAPWHKLYREDPPEPFCPEDKDLEDYWELIGDRCSCRRLEMSRQDVLRMKNFYYACVSFVDYQVGRIVKTLKDKGMYDDTLIVFSSDHGDMVGDYKAIGKRTMMDSSCRVPLIIHYPGKEPATRSDVCSLVDIAPTLLGFVGAPYDAGEFDGVDLFSGQRHTHVFSQYGCGSKGVYMVTDGQDKLVHNMNTGRYFLFDTVPDRKNVYEPDHPAVRRLKPLLDAYRSGDCNAASVSETVDNKLYTNTHPHYAGRLDQAMFREREGAEIPEEYNVDVR